MSDASRDPAGDPSEPRCAQSPETLPPCGDTDDVEQLEKRLAERLEQWEREQAFAAPSPEEHREADAAAPDTEAAQIPPHPGVVQLPPLPGGSVGKYEIRRALGEGGQAAAHLAWDPDLQRHVVLKIYRQAARAGAQVVLEEGRALVRVRSPHVARCLHLEQRDEAPQLVMEYVPGRDLAHRPRKQPPLEDVIRWMRQVAEGLAAIHACGLIHRDVKPANIIVGDDGNARLVDLGLAAPVGSPRLEDTSGTVPYMAPEQARGEAERVDPRSDLFSWGVVLFELLAGQPPFPPARPEACQSPSASPNLPSLADVRPDVPEPLAQLCRQCLAPSPEQRPAGAAEVAARMARIEQRSAARGGSRWRVIAVAAAAILAPLALLVAWGTWHTPADLADARPASQVTATAAAEPQLTGLPTAMPDGRTLRRDFPLRVTLIGARQAGDGVVQLAAGQSLQVEVLAERDCFLTVVSIEGDSDNRLFPNRAQPDAFLAAGARRRIPGRPTVAGVEPQELIATPSERVEYILVIASSSPWESGQGRPAGNYQAFVEPGERREWRERLRGLKLQPRSEGPDRTIAVAEVLVPYRVGPYRDE